MSSEYHQTEVNHKPAIRRKDLATSLERGAMYQETSPLLPSPCCFGGSGAHTKATADIPRIPGDQLGGTATSPTTNSDTWNRFARTTSALHGRDAAGMERADLCATTLPGHSWARRKKLLFVSPSWKRPKGSNVIYQNFSIQKQLSVFPGLQSVTLPHICARPTQQSSPWASSLRYGNTLFKEKHKNQKMFIFR